MSYKQLEVSVMKKDGFDAEDILRYLVLSLRDDKALSTTLAKAGLSKNAGRPIITGEGTVNLDSAVRLAEACGYRLTLEVIEDE